MIEITADLLISKITREDYLVGNYEVNIFHKACSCRGNHYNGHCKHILQAEKHHERTERNTQT